MKVVTVRNLNFRYRRSRRFVLKDVSFEVNAGEFVGIIGPSGSGKSTLCLALSGIVPNSIGGEFEGEVIIRDPKTGVEYNTLTTPVSRISTVLGLVLQNPDSQLFNMTVEDEVAFALENLGLSRDEILDRVRWALELVGLSGLEDEFPPNLSGGQKQRLVIASVLAMRPSILVLDEPTSQLDPIGRREVLDVLSNLRKRLKVTTILVDHNTRYIMEHADRVLVMNEGTILMEGTPAELLRSAGTLKEIGVKLPVSWEVYLELKERGLERYITPLREYLPV